MKFYLFLLVALNSVLLSAQEKYFVNNVSLDSLKSEYVQIVGTSKFMSTKLTIDLDFGQYNSVWKASDTQVKNSSGKKIELNSMVDALNFMVANGYEFTTAYVVTIGNQNVYHYLLRKIITSPIDN